ncbi:hypothetical protein NOCA2120128 [metagenome]|uniref:Uncharacterized protein n=1 Tax=metagenome TaxID=256318 RepID=A0A2P2BWG9_9ZZZZ
MTATALIAPFDFAREPRDVGVVSAAHRIVRVAVAAEVRGADPAKSIAPLVRAWCHGRLPLLRRTSHHGERLQLLLASTLHEIAGQVQGQRAAAALRDAADQIDTARQSLPHAS